MDHPDRLRLLANNDERLTEELIGGTGVECATLDPRTLALVRLAALVAVGPDVATTLGYDIDDALER